MKRPLQLLLLGIILCLSLFIVVKPITTSNHATTLSANSTQMITNSIIPMTAYATPTSPVVTDGIKDNIWGDAGYQTLTFTNGTGPNADSIPVNFYVLHDSTYLYFAFQYQDPTFATGSFPDTANVMMDRNTSATTWNQISTGGPVDDFDVITATWTVGLNTSYALDRYSYNGAFDTDVSLGGTNDTHTGGSYDYATHTYFYELSQPLSSSDTKHDIQVQVGDSMLIWPYIYKDGVSYTYENFGNLAIVSKDFPHNTPEITIKSPTDGSTTYNRNIHVDFIVNLRTSWIGYSLDFGPNVTVTGNFIMNLVSDGSHKLIIYANSSFNMMGKSIILNFSVDSHPSSSSLTTFPVYATSTPISIDGVKEVVWDQVGYHTLTLTNGSDSFSVNFYVLHDTNNIYFALQYQDDTFTTGESFDLAEVVLDMNTSATFWNQIGSNVDTFDVVTASWAVGSNTSYAIDRYSYNGNFYADTSDGGVNNTHTGASYDYSTHTYFYELSQPLNSTDYLHDISLQVGDHALVLPAVLKNGVFYTYEKIGNLIIEPGEYPIQSLSSSSLTSLVSTSSSTSSQIPGFTEFILLVSFCSEIIYKRKKRH